MFPRPEMVRLSVGGCMLSAVDARLCEATGIRLVSFALYCIGT